VQNLAKNTIGTGRSYNDALDALCARLREFPKLSKKDERDLARRYAQGDIEARNTLVASNMLFVVGRAHVHARRSKNCRLLHDLVQEGSIGLIKAAKRFDPDKGVKFISYAKTDVDREITDYLLCNHRAVKLGTTQAQKNIFYGIETDEHALAKKSGVRVQTLRKHMDVMGQQDVFLDECMPGTDITLHETIPTEGVYDTERFVEERSDAEMLHEALAYIVVHGTNSKRERNIYDMIARCRWLNDEPMTQERIGFNFDITSERIRQHEKVFKRKVRDYLIS